MWHLDNFSNDQLIDIVKNYESYNYDVTVKYQALALLKDRGINEEDLALVGNPKGQELERKKDLFKDFKRNSLFSFSIYFILIVFQFFVNSLITLALFSSLFVLFFVFILLSFINQKEFYKVINQEEKSSNAFLFFLIGMPFYPIFYWYTLREMKENML